MLKKINATGNPGCTLFNSECTISAKNTLRIGPGATRILESISSLIEWCPLSKWNMLDNDFVMAKTVNGFKTKLERERAKKMGLFLD